MGDGVTDMEVMIALMEDLNVRGATAFVHLVQNADEFTAAVNDLQNSAGAAHEMAMVQQEQLKNQIQVVKTALLAPFILSDKVGAEAGYLNQFAMEIHGIVDVVEGLFVQTMSDGSAELTKMGEIMRDFVIGALSQGKDVLIILVNIIKDFSEAGHDMTGMLNVATVPLKIVLRLANLMGDGFFEAIIAYKIFTGIIPINSMYLAKNIEVIKASMGFVQQEIVWKGKKLSLDQLNNKITATQIKLDKTKSAGWKTRYKNDLAELNMQRQKAGANFEVSRSLQSIVLSQMMANVVQFAAMYATQKIAKNNILLAGTIGALAGAYMGYAIAMKTAHAASMSWKDFGAEFYGLILGSAAIGAGFNMLMQQLMKPPDIDMSDFSVEDTGGRFMARRTYDMGGYTQEHGLAMVQQGETIIPKTQNMLGGASGGITLNIHGDVYDSDNFAEKISEVLPLAMRKSNDIGGF
jgi:hypothetical protein